MGSCGGIQRDSNKLRKITAILNFFPSLSALLAHEALEGTEERRTHLTSWYELYPLLIDTLFYTKCHFEAVFRCVSQ